MMKKPSNNAFKPRSLVEARCSLTASENDVFDMLLSYVNKDDDDPNNLLYTLVIDDFKDKFNLRYAENAYRKVRDGVAKLKGKTIDIWSDDGERFDSFVLFQSIHWNDKKGSIIVKVGEDIKKILNAQKQSITYYEVRYTLPMSSRYSKLLYVMFKEWLKTGVRYDNVSMLRDKLHVPSSYSYGMFKKRVLETAVKEINSTTDIVVSYIEKRQKVRGGQKVTELAFQINKKECAIDKIEQCGGQMILDYLISNGVSNVTYDQAVIIYRTAQKGNLTNQQIKKRMNIVLQKKNIKNLVGYMIFAMSDKFKSPEDVKRGLDNFSQRNYSQEWYQLLEKKMLSPEKMTDDEWIRFDELTAQAN